MQEAKVLRGIVDEHFKADPNARLVVLGDFNDVKDSDSVREIIGRGKFKLTDTRPAERNGDNAPAENSNFDPRNVTWTEYYGKEDIYTRMDYILLSPALARDWVKAETYIPDDSELGRRLRPPANRRDVQDQLKHHLTGAIMTLKCLYENIDRYRCPAKPRQLAQANPARRRCGRHD